MPAQKPYTRFSISALLLLITLVAFVLLALKMNRQASEIQRVTNQNENLVMAFRVQSRLSLILKMEPQNEEERRVVYFAKITHSSIAGRVFRLDTDYAGNPLGRRPPRLIDVGGDSDDLEILLIDRGNGNSVLALFDDEKVIDTLSLYPNTYEHPCTQEFAFEDLNNDGLRDVSVNRFDLSRRSQHLVEVRSSGFTYIVKKATSGNAN